MAAEYNEQAEQSSNPFDDMRLKLQKCRGRDNMIIEDNNEQSLNPFIAKHQQREAKVAQSGLGDILDLMAVESEAEKRICSNGITDEVEKRKVFEEVKQQRLEYKEHIRQSISKPISAVTDVEDTTEQPIEEDDESEFRRGYEHCIQYEKRQEERNQRPYLKGWHAAYQEILHNKALAMEAEEEQSETSFISVTVENSAITQLREEIKQLDERLRKLERYTEE